MEQQVGHVTIKLMSDKGGHISYLIEGYVMGTRYWITENTLLKALELFDKIVSSKEQDKT